MAKTGEIVTVFMQFFKIVCGCSKRVGRPEARGEVLSPSLGFNSDYNRIRVFGLVAWLNMFMWIQKLRAGKL